MNTSFARCGIPRRSQPHSQTFNATFWALGLLIVGLGNAQAASPYTYLDLGTLGGSYADTGRINNDGDVVGYSATSGYSPYHAFLYSNGSMQDLGTLGGTNSYAFGINDNAQVVGNSLTSGDSAYRAFFDSNGSMQDLGTLGGTGSNAYGINNNGQIVGNSQTSGNSATHAFVYSNGSMQDLGTLGGSDSSATAISNNGQIVGSSNISGNSGDHAFLYSNGSMQDLGTLGGIHATAFGVNDNGQVVGESTTSASSSSHAFLYSNGGMQDLGVLAGLYSYAYGINNYGQVVGESATGGNAADHAFLYIGSGGLIDLNTLPGLPATLYSATAINDYGQIAGRNSSDHPYLITLNPSWSALAGGSWDDPSNWSYAGLGSLGFTPGKPHDVMIDPTTLSTITGPGSNTQINSLTLGGTGGGITTLDLQAGSTLIATNGTTINSNATLSGTGGLQSDIANSGVIQLNGNIQGKVTNDGFVKVTAGNTLHIAGTGHTNNGTVQVIGVPSNLATIGVTGGMTNSSGGRIVLQNALYQGSGSASVGNGGTPTTITGGLANSGQVLVNGPSNDIFGPIDNLAGGSIIVSGAGGATFYGTLKNNGSVKVSAGSIATFFGYVTGAGAYLGTGTSFYEGTLHVGNSPAQVTTDTVSVFDASSILDLDLAGAAGPGNCADCYGQLIFNNDVQFDGGSLKVNFYDGFTASAGDMFQLFVFNSTHEGSFGNLQLPTLANGLTWNTSRLYDLGDLSVSAVPLPGALWLFASVLPFLVRRRKRN